MAKLVKDFFATKVELKIYLSLLLFVTVILFIISNDSYTHNLWGNWDSSAFFTCGKAWMNGMIPYVDFADSKGPLLWFITGIAYLISPYDYVGVFWLSCLSFSITFYFCYKIGTLLTDSRRLGYVVSILMAFPYFMIWYEMKAEVWCNPFITASLYCLLREILSPSIHSSYAAGAVLGLSFMATLLMKWSIAVMSLSFAISYLILLLHRKTSILRFCINFLLAAIVLLLPFLIYFLVTNSFKAFIFEYFLNTGASVSEGGASDFFSSYIQDISRLLTGKHGVFRPGVFCLLYLVGVFLFYHYRRNVTLLPFFCCTIFLAISTKHNIWTYYTLTVNTFAVFLVALIVMLCYEKVLSKRKLGKYGLATIYIAAMLIISVMRGYACYRNDAFFFQNKNRKAYYDAAWLMWQLRNHNSTIMYLGHVDMGIGMPVNVLPGCTYWTDQVGKTDEMTKLQWQSIEKAEPDFISIDVNYNGSERECALASGYQYYLTVKGQDLYGRKGLKFPPKNFKVSNTDILLKRKIKFDY